MCFSHLFSFLLFFCFLIIPQSVCACVCICVCSHPTQLMTLATTYAFKRPGENPGIVYDQAGVLLLKVIPCLLHREHAVVESRVYADRKIAHNKWNCVELICNMLGVIQGGVGGGSVSSWEKNTGQPVLPLSTD